LIYLVYVYADQTERSYAEPGNDISFGGEVWVWGSFAIEEVEEGLFVGAIKLDGRVC